MLYSLNFLNGYTSSFFKKYLSKTNGPKGKMEAKNANTINLKDQRFAIAVSNITNMYSTKRTPWTNPGYFTASGMLPMYLIGMATKNNTKAEMPSMVLTNLKRPRDDFNEYVDIKNGCEKTFARLHQIEISKKGIRSDSLFVEDILRSCRL